MLAATLIKHLYQRAGQALATLGAERRCALRLDRLGDRLELMGERINYLRSRMLDDAGEAIDGDHALRDALKGLKEDIRAIRCQLASLQTPRLTGRLQRAFARLGRIAEATYLSADQLQWEINDHDSQLR